MSASQVSSTRTLVPLLVCAVALAWSAPGDARGGRGGGGGGMARASAHGSVNGGARGGDFDRGGGDINRADVNRADVNRNTNISSNRNVNVNVEGNDHWNDWDDHPVATGAAVAAGVALTSAAIGSIAYSVPPSCVPQMVGDVTYQQCGDVWYQPQYAGSNVQYVVVSPP
jgi:hypothetical protein